MRRFVSVAKMRRLVLSLKLNVKLGNEMDRQRWSSERDVPSSEDLTLVETRRMEVTRGNMDGIKFIDVHVVHLVNGIANSITVNSIRTHVNGQVVADVSIFNARVKMVLMHDVDGWKLIHMST